MGLFGVSAAGFAAVLVWGMTGLPAFGDFDGEYGKLLAQSGIPQRSVGEIVAATVFDYRGFDTLGEEFILFCAVVGATVLIRVHRAEGELPPGPAEELAPPSEGMRVLVGALAAPVLVLGIYIVAHGHLTPGGGFQGGIVLVAAFLLIYLAGRRLTPHTHRPLAAAEFLEGLGAAGFALVGLAGLIIAGTYLENFLPFGTFGQLLSGGQIPLSNVVVALEIMGAVLVVIAEFLDQRLLSSESR